MNSLDPSADTGIEKLCKTKLQSRPCLNPDWVLIY